VLRIIIITTSVSEGDQRELSVCSIYLQSQAHMTEV
jgi:hypothetical protein